MLKVTTKELKEQANVYSLSDSNIYYLFYNHDPIANNVGTYGLNFELYSMYGLMFTVGNRGCVGCYVDYKLVEKYNNEAKNILHNNNMKSTDKKMLIEKILMQFVEEVINAEVKGVE